MIFHGMVNVPYYGNPPVLHIINKGAIKGSQVYQSHDKYERDKNDTHKGHCQRL
jgi:hypothetical protein